jgi:hypothetical protein
MPKAPSIFFNQDEWEAIKKRIRALQYPSFYAYIKDLVLKDLKISNIEKA